MKYALPFVLSMFVAMPAVSSELEQHPASATTQQAEVPETAAATPAINNSSDAGFYAGLKLGSLLVDVPDMSFGAPVGVVLGFGSPALGVELDVIVSDLSVAGESLSYSAAGIYGVYTSNTPVYLKLRAGLLQQSISTVANNTNIAVVSDFGFSAGIGAGKRFSNNFVLDFDYTLIEADVSSFTIGLTKRF